MICKTDGNMHMSMTLSYNQIILMKAFIYKKIKNHQPQCILFLWTPKWLLTNTNWFFFVKYIKNIWIKKVDTLFCLLKGDKINISWLTFFIINALFMCIVVLYLLWWQFSFEKHTRFFFLRICTVRSFISSIY